MNPWDYFTAGLYVGLVAGIILVAIGQKLATRLLPQKEEE